MSYTPKLDWTSANPVSAADLIRIEQGIKNAVPKDGSEAMTGALTIPAQGTAANSYSQPIYMGFVDVGGVAKFGYLQADPNGNISFNDGTTAYLLWTAKNDGSGSGLDADTVRGKVALPVDGSVIMTGGPTIGVQSPTGASGSNPIFFQYRDATLKTVWLQVGPSGQLQFYDGVATQNVWNTGQLRLGAGVLEYLDAGTWKVAGGVKSIQRNVSTIPADVSTTLNVAISSVNLAKSYVIISQTTDAQANSSAMAYATLTSSTNLQLTRIWNSITTTIAWQVIESY